MTIVNQQTNTQIQDVSKEIQFEHELNLKLGLVQPDKFSTQTFDLWNSLFNLIRSLYLAGNLDEETIPVVIEEFGNLNTQAQKLKFLDTLRDMSEQKAVIAATGMMILQQEYAQKQFDRILRLIPDQYIEPFLNYLFNDKIPQEILDNLTTTMDLENLSEDQIKDLAQSAVYRYRQNGLNLGNGERRGFSNNAKPMTKEELSNLLDSTKDIQSKIEEIPVNGFNPLLDNSQNPLSQAREDGFRNSATSLSQLLGQKQKNLLNQTQPTPDLTAGTSSPSLTSDLSSRSPVSPLPTRPSIPTGLNISGAKAITRSLLSQKRQNSGNPVISKPQVSQNSNSTGTSASPTIKVNPVSATIPTVNLPRIPTPLNPNFRPAMAPRPLRPTNTSQPVPKQDIAKDYRPSAGQGQFPNRPGSVPGSPINKF